RPERSAEVLAAADVPTTAAALGSSIVQAAAVAEELGRTNWELVRSAIALDGEWASDAQALRARLVEGLERDEVAMPLVARLRQAVVAATDLLTRAATRTDPGSVHTTSRGPEPVPAPQHGTAPPPVPTPGGIDREAAEAQLRALRERLRAEARLDLN